MCHLLACGGSGALIVPKWPSASFWPLIFKRGEVKREFVKDVLEFKSGKNIFIKGRVAQSVTCLATDACLTADPGVVSSIPARSHTFVEIDHEIISTVILLPSADSFKKGCYQLQAKVCAQITGYPLVQACPGKSVVRLTDRPAMTIAVDLGRKATKPTNQPRQRICWYIWNRRFQE